MPSNGQFRDSGEGLAGRLERMVRERTRGRIRDFRIELAGDRVIVRGRADSYHVKQLALQAVAEANGPVEVELDIRVGDCRAGAEAHGEPDSRRIISTVLEDKVKELI